MDEPKLPDPAYGADAAMSAWLQRRRERAQRPAGGTGTTSDGSICCDIATARQTQRDWAVASFRNVIVRKAETTDS